MTLIEVIIVTAIIVAFSGLGIASYITFQNSALRASDILDVRSMLHQARFSAVKPADGSDFGIHLDLATNTVELFRNTYEAGNVLQGRELATLSIATPNLQPSPGITQQVLFQKITGETVNSGSFTLEAEGVSYTFDINAQGKID